MHDRVLATFAQARQRLTLGISDHVAGPELPALIARVLGPGVALVNPAAMAVAEAAALLPGAGTGKGPHRFLVSGDPEPFYKLAAGMLPGAVTQVEQAQVSGGEALHDRVQPVVV